MTPAEILALRNKRAGIVSGANALLTKAKTEKRDLTAAEAEEFDKRHNEADELETQISREERQMKANSSLEQRSGPRPGDKVVDNHPDTLYDQDVIVREAGLAKRNLAIGGWLRMGMADLPPEQRQLMQALHDSSPEMRALTAGTNSAGGYTIAPDTSFYGQILEGMKDYSLDESMFEVLNTGTGASLPIPTNDDTANTGSATTEGADAGDAADVTFGQIEFSAFIRTSGMLKVSNVLISDSSVNVEQFVGKKLGERIARKKAVDLTTGSGTNAPRGIVTASTLGVTGASATGIAYTDFIELEHSVDPAHRANGRYMFHDDVLKATKKMVDSQGRPLWVPGVASGAPDLINGRPYVVNQNMPKPVAGAKSMVFGNFKKFMVRNVQGFSIQRLVERFAEFNQVAFVGFARWDSDLLDAGENPIKHFKQAAS